MVTAIFLPSLDFVLKDVSHASNLQAYRRHFMELPICKWIEQQEMRYHTGFFGPQWAVLLHVTKEQYILLQMKLDDPKQLRWLR